MNSARLLCVFALVLIALSLYLLFRSIRLEIEAAEVRERLRKLSLLTLQHFPEPKQVNGPAFWKAIGRETQGPMKDEWGKDFIMETRSAADRKIQVVWRSAGPDQVLGSQDDLEVQVPFPEGSSGLDFSPPQESTGIPALDAR